LEAGDPRRWDIDLGEYLPHIHFLGDRLAETLANNPADMAAAGRMIGFASGVEKYLEHRREVPGGPWLEAAASACRTIGDRLGEVRFATALARFHYAKRDSQNGIRTAYDAWKLAVDGLALGLQAEMPRAGRPSPEWSSQELAHHKDNPGPRPQA